ALLRTLGDGREVCPRSPVRSSPGRCQDLGNDRFRDAGGAGAGHRLGHGSVGIRAAGDRDRSRRARRLAGDARPRPPGPWTRLRRRGGRAGADRRRRRRAGHQGAGVPLA
ncbi:MAG: hypothetical protein AVDCRST_MAG19-763, partial [uncultured Thermomicrobiales bacterium]